jgi:hypothetical protein
MDMVTQHLRSRGSVIGQNIDLLHAGQNNLSPSDGRLALSNLIAWRLEDPRNSPCPGLRVESHEPSWQFLGLHA